jgi:antitoxin HigA-1
MGNWDVEPEWGMHTMSMRQRFSPKGLKEHSMRPRTRKPTHPGAIVRLDYIEPLGLSVTALAERLGVSRKHLSAIVNERSGLTPDMALRLSRAFGTTPGLWLNMQQALDL